MLRMSNENDKQKMMNYYRTSDMLNLLYFFPELSPITDIVLVETVDEYINNFDFFNSFNQNRVDTLKGRKFIDGIENRGIPDNFYETFKQAKEIDPYAVLVLFNIDCSISERYERYAGISVGVELGKCVLIDAVSQGFDGREVSKNICNHERYYIPWFDIRNLNMNNFKNYRTFLIGQKDYLKTRIDRIDFLTSIGCDKNILEKSIPYIYQEIPDFIWLNVINCLLKELLKQEDILKEYNLTSFAISGHTEGKVFKPWQLFDKSRYTSYIKK